MARFVVVCPGCDTHVDPGVEPATRCPECGRDWPPELADRLSHLSARERPLGVSVIMLLYAFWSGLALLGIAAFVTAEGPLIVGGVEVPKGRALDFLLPVLVPLALALVGSSLALWLERSWARPTALFPLLLAMLLPPLAAGQTALAPAGEPWVLAAVLTPVVALLGWYLYFTPRVREYYRLLREGDPEPQPVTADRADSDPAHHSAAPVECDVCGGEMVYTAMCKLRCPRCGYARDCSDP